MPRRLPRPLRLPSRRQHPPRLPYRRRHRAFGPQSVRPTQGRAPDDDGGCTGCGQPVCIGSPSRRALPRSHGGLGEHASRACTTSQARRITGPRRPAPICARTTPRRRVTVRRSRRSTHSASPAECGITLSNVRWPVGRLRDHLASPASDVTIPVAHASAAPGISISTLSRLDAARPAKQKKGRPRSINAPETQPAAISDRHATRAAERTAA